MVSTIPRSKLVVRERQRTAIQKPPLNELKESILARGLLHPPVVWKLENDEWLLVVGERRTRAIELIGKEGKFYSCDGQTFDPKQGDLPVTFCTLETLLQVKQAELEENIMREPISWQDQARAFAQIHALNQEANPKQTVVDTARELVAKGAPSVSANSLRNKVRESQIITEHLSDPAIASARNASEAYALVLKKEEEKALAALAKKRQAKEENAARDFIIRHDALVLYPPENRPYNSQGLVALPGSEAVRCNQDHHERVRLSARLL